MTKILIFIISLFILSPSKMMGLKRLWRSFSVNKLKSLENLDKRPKTVMGIYSDPVLIENRRLDFFNELAEKFYITKIILKNKSDAQYNLRLLFNNPKDCLNYKPLTNKKSCKFLRTNFEHKILFSTESFSDLKDFISYKVKRIKKTINEYKLIIIFDENVRENIINIDINIFFSAAFHFNLFNFNRVTASGIVLGLILKTDELNYFDYSSLNTKYLIYNQKILI